MSDKTNHPADALTAARIDWASQHDWFFARHSNGIVVVDDDGSRVVFSSWSALRDWAGY